MQKKLFCAVLAAMLTFSLSGCFRKNDDRDPSSQASPSHPSSENREESSGGIVSDIGEGASDIVSDIGEGASDLASDIGEGASDLMGGDDEYDGNGDVLDDGINDSEKYDESSVPADKKHGITASLAVETAAAAADIASLSSEKQGWGQGVQLNEKNQPLSALSFQDRYGKYDAHFIGEEENTLYLTFDCGYENGYTPVILDTLKEKGVPAVFFVTLDYAKSEPDLIRRMIDEGHAIGNHSDKHPSFPDVSADRRKQEIENVERYMTENFGYTGMDLFRPPCGEFSEQVLAQMQQLGYKTLFWSYAYKDWDPNAQMGPEKALEKVNGALHDGAIYLLHAVSSDNAAILDEFIDHARSKGYSFELFS